MIPPPKSKKWIVVFILFTVVVFIGLLTTRVLFGSTLSNQSIMSFLLISIVSALIPSIGGFLGKQVFYSIFTLSTIVGILYMFYVVLGNTAPGWGDLTSIIGYLFIVGIGAVLALVTEIVYYFIKTKKQ